MKHCDNCGKGFDGLKTLCPLCGGEPREADDADEFTALLLPLGLL